MATAVQAMSATLRGQKLFIECCNKCRKVPSPVLEPVSNSALNTTADSPVPKASHKPQAHPRDRGYQMLQIGGISSNWYPGVSPVTGSGLVKLFLEYSN